MEIILNLMLTCGLVVLIMLCIEELAERGEKNEFQKITRHEYFHLAGGSFVMLTLLFAFIWVLMLIWS